MAGSSVALSRDLPLEEGWVAICDRFAAVSAANREGPLVTGRSGRSACAGPDAGGGGSPGLHGAIAQEGRGHPRRRVSQEPTRAA